MTRRVFPRFFVHFAFICAMLFVARGAVAQTAKTAAQTPTVSVEQHRNELTQTLRQLRTWQKGVAPSLKQLEKAMPPAQERIVKRRDGATQTLNGDDWSSYINDFDNWATNGAARVRRDGLRNLTKLFESRLRALDEWSRGAYQAADAQNIVRALASNNDISTEPPRFLVWWQSAKDIVGDWVNRVFSWRPVTPTPTATPRWNANTTWINFFFASTLAALLVAIAWWLWRTFGGRWTRNMARRDVVFSGEDAELLLLPPDELRARAERLAGEGRFDQALRHRYIAILLSLDGQNVWRYDTRRTNWEHIAALKKKRATQTLVAPLSSLTERFDRVRYGEMICTQPDWTRFAHDAASLESLTSSTRSAINDAVSNDATAKEVAA